ncbi:WD40 repeat domain-containing protein [Streptomyces sp. NPDC000609]|uniref:nSTAND1 domain-containing NTPase n=1 Tax=Streptomyces sp. NPDC000609 TaxID=3160957 RepID=UPI003394ED69
MSLPGDPAPELPEVRFQAEASGNARIYQTPQDMHIAQRDMHVHYQDGVRSARRASRGTPPGECPYPGLAAFGTEQAQWFHGRGTLTADVLDRLDERMGQGGALMVIAPSGAGKSSLLRAGVVAAIQRGDLAFAGSDQWPCVVFTPTDRPVAALAAGLSQVSGHREQWSAILEQGPAACVEWMHTALRDRDTGHEGGREWRQGRRWVVVVDQLEELFTQCGSEPERRVFLDFLQAMSQQGADGQAPPALVLYGLRSDFLDPCLMYQHLLAAHQNTSVFVGPMSEAEVRESILFPAADAGLEVEPGLVELLLKDLGQPAGTAPSTQGVDGTGVGRYETGRLPLLAHALRATWQQRAGHFLTTDGYRTTGGIARAVATTADREYSRLSPEDRHTARLLLLALTKIGDTTADIRRRIDYTSLLDRSGNHESAARVIEAFTRARLLTREHGSIEITHEVLLRAWPRLWGWIDTDRAGNLTRQEIEESAANWIKAGRDPSMLYRGNRLESALDWEKAAHVARAGSDLGDFLDAGRKQNRRAISIRRSVIGVLAALALTTSVLAGVAFKQSNAAQRETQGAIRSQLQGEAEGLRSTQQSLAAQLDLIAYEMKPSSVLGTALINDANNPLSVTLGDQIGTVGSVVFSPRGHTLATVGREGLVQLWDVADPAHASKLGEPLTGHTGGVGSVVFGPRGRTLATVGREGLVQLWDVADPAHASKLGEPLTGLVGGVGSVVFSSDGNTLATIGDGTVRLWDVTDRARATQLSTPAGLDSGVGSVAFSSDGNTLATVSNTTVRLWDVTDPARATQVGTLTGHTKTVRAVAFSLQGHTLASAGDDCTVRLWDVADPAHATQLGDPLTGHTSGVLSVVFSPDNNTLASASYDGTVRLWDVTDPDHAAQLGAPLASHTGAVDSVAFSSDNNTLASASDDGTVRLWNLPPALSRPLSDLPDIVESVAFSPRGHTLATVSNTTVRLWNVTDPAHASELGSTLADGVGSVAFSPRGRTLATIGDGTVQLWDVADPAHASKLGEPLTGLGGGVGSVAFSSDGNTLATIGDGTVQLWDVTDQAHATQLGALTGPAGGGVRSVAFRPHGNVLASASEDGTVRLWDVTDPAHASQLGNAVTGRTGAVFSVAFSPDGNVIAAAGYDNAVRLWDVADPAHATQLGHTLTGHTHAVHSVAFSSDGKTLASTSTDRTVRLWKWDIDEARRQICANTDSVTPEQWKQYLPQLDYDPPCS